MFQTHKWNEIGCFYVGCGLKQGCSLSTFLFNLYQNDLLIRLNSLEIGVRIGGEKVTTLLYVNDLALVCRFADPL